MTNGYDLAYPFELKKSDGSTYQIGSGLTKREYFAAMAMQGILSAGVSIDIDKEYPFKTRANTCTVIADALIKALNETQQ